MRLYFQVLLIQKCLNKLHKTTSLHAHVPPVCLWVGVWTVDLEVPTWKLTSHLILLAPIWTCLLPPPQLCTQVHTCQWWVVFIPTHLAHLEEMMDFTPTQKCVAHFEVLRNRVNTSALACITTGIYYTSWFLTRSLWGARELAQAKGVCAIFKCVLSFNTFKKKKKTLLNPVPGMCFN